MKSKKFLENFSIGQNGIIDFAKTEEDYSNSDVKKTFMQRMLHLSSLDDQVKKSLKFPDIQNEEREKKSLDDEELLDLLDFDESVFSDDF